jgi:hypothetical protein
MEIESPRKFSNSRNFGDELISDDAGVELDQNLANLLSHVLVKSQCSSQNE